MDNNPGDFVVRPVGREVMIGGYVLMTVSALMRDFDVAENALLAERAITSDAPPATDRDWFMIEDGVRQLMQFEFEDIIGMADPETLNDRQFTALLRRVGSVRVGLGHAAVLRLQSRFSESEFLRAMDQVLCAVPASVPDRFCDLVFRGNMLMGRFDQFEMGRTHQ